MPWGLLNSSPSSPLRGNLIDLMFQFGHALQQRLEVAMRWQRWTGQLALPLVMGARRSVAASRFRLSSLYQVGAALHTPFQHCGDLVGHQA